MLLDYVALFLVIFVIIFIFYAIIVIHDIPYEISVHRNHPHQDAIHVAGWVSLFTLHVLWPFLWIWSTLYREDRGWGFNNIAKSEQPESGLEDRIQQLEEKIVLLQDKIPDQQQAQLTTESGEE